MVIKRSLIIEEKDLIREYQGLNNEECDDSFFDASIAFDGFITDGPGYAGTVLVVVWPAGVTETYAFDKDRNLVRWD